MDTGISANHSDLRVAGGATFVPNETSYSDTNGYGTHVAGIISALRNGQGLVGIAPEADLYMPLKSSIQVAAAVTAG
ncbi:S8 family serine peptidase [Paenibacillus sp. WQ 127069]|uniref:S8 family serine peptidase n=1 Tax=Paenibacillus baimaensis TaxID=2982185 RepID=A0ABT2UUK5_9BACL|nr:S8 family serine peptidase [Paenibacillus sp. WQ 127069]MCU6798329.1 S8 family serine peptidase [Paenibacillus sp. WQ 127069]